MTVVSRGLGLRWGSGETAFPILNRELGCVIMLADRHYMREFRGRTSLSLSAILMIVLGVAFGVQSIAHAYWGPKLELWFALTRDGMKTGWVWQLITFQFLHGSLWHLLGNLLGVWFLGRYVEQMLGKSRFLLAYLGSGVAGGVLQGALMLIFPRHFGSLLYGASAGVAGVFTILALLEGDAILRLNFIFPIRARTLLWIFAAITLFFTLVPAAGDNTAHAAHLGGMLGGWLFVRLGWHHDYQPLPGATAWSHLQHWWRGKPRRVKRRSPPRQWAPWFESLATKPSRRAPRSPGEVDESFISEQVDPILDKISAHGIHRLTDEERKILERARARIAKR